MCQILSINTNISSPQGVDSGVEDTIKESRSHLAESVEGVACLVGRLCLARRHLDGFTTRVLPPSMRGEVFPEITDDFLTMEVQSVHTLFIIIYMYVVNTECAFYDS